MARLPEPGGDSGNWGVILNNYLGIAHNDDGSLKNTGVVADKYVKPTGGIPKTDLDASVQASLSKADAAATGGVTTVAGRTGDVVLTTSDITSGTFVSARIPTLDAAKVTSGAFDVARIPSLDAAKTSSGVFDIARIPTGTTATTVAVGNHTHANYATTAHTHDDRYYTETEVDGFLQATQGDIANVRRVLVNAQTGASYVLALSDEGVAVHYTVAAIATLTVPPASSVAFAVGAMIEVVQMGAGSITLAPGSGVTLLSADNLLTTRTQYSVVSLRKSDIDTWVVAGDLV